MEKQTLPAGAPATDSFFSLVNHSLKLKIYLLTKVPAAFFSGVKVVIASPEACTVSVPYRRFTKNPFRSTYFACLSMAAELSTGVLAMAAVYKRRPAIRLIITAMEARFLKKATGLTLFTCNEGQQLLHTAGRAVSSGEAQEVTVHSVGRNDKNEVVAEFWFTWSFKTV